MIKTIIFDFNGTLLDDCDVCLKILNILTNKYGIGKVSKRKYKEIFTFPVSNYYLALGFDVKKDFTSIGSEFHMHYNQLSYNEAKLFNDVIPLLKYLKDKYQLVCLSASRIDTLIKQLRYYKIDIYFNYILGLEDQLARSKMEVGINFINEKKLNKDEVLFIGDSIHDLEVAKAMGVNCYLVNTGHTAKHRLLKETNNVINHLHEIKDIFGEN